MKTRSFAITVAAAIVGIAASANAESLTMTFNALGPSRTIKANFNSGRSYGQGNASGWTSYSAGRMLWTDQYGRNLTTYCTQIKENISYNQTVTYTITGVDNVPDPVPGPMGAIKAQLIGDLYRRHYLNVIASNSADLHSAFQLAIWEITHENLAAADANGALAQLNVFVGAMAANSSHATTQTVGALATSLLASLGTDDGFGDGLGLIGLTHGSAQDQLLVVPIPAPLALAGAGLLGVAALRRRRIVG